MCYTLFDTYDSPFHKIFISGYLKISYRDKYAKLILDTRDDVTHV